jgi:hypothetical protein
LTGEFGREPLAFRQLSVLKHPFHAPQLIVGRQGAIARAREQSAETGNRED